MVCFLIMVSYYGTYEFKSHYMSELDVWGSIPRMAAMEFEVLDVWTSSFQGDADDLFLLLEQARGRSLGKCSLALPGSGKASSQHLDAP